jgi:hypothetical protein
MSDQSNQLVQRMQNQEELRLRTLEQFLEGDQNIKELNDEELEAVAGAGVVALLKDTNQVFEKHDVWKHTSNVAMSVFGLQITNTLLSKTHPAG